MSYKAVNKKIPSNNKLYDNKKLIIDYAKKSNSKYLSKLPENFVEETFEKFINYYSIESRLNPLFSFSLYLSNEIYKLFSEEIKKENLDLEIELINDKKYVQIVDYVFLRLNKYGMESIDKEKILMNVFENYKGDVNISVAIAKEVKREIINYVKENGLEETAENEFLSEYEYEEELNNETTSENDYDEEYYDEESNRLEEPKLDVIEESKILDNVDDKNVENENTNNNKLDESNKTDIIDDIKEDHNTEVSDKTLDDNKSNQIVQPIDEEKIIIENKENNEEDINEIQEANQKNVVKNLKKRAKIKRKMVREISNVEEDRQEEQLNINERIIEYIKNNRLTKVNNDFYDNLIVKYDLIRKIKNPNIKIYIYLRYGYYNGICLSDIDIIKFLDISEETLNNTKEQLYLTLKEQIEEKIDIIISNGLKGKSNSYLLKVN